MMMPKKVKFRKQQRGRMAGKAWRGSSISFGDFGLKAMECGWITARQIEAARVAMTRSIKRGGKVWIRLFPDKPITKKPAETRMGKGKGAPEEWVCVIRPGKILCEMEGVTKERARMLTVWRERELNPENAAPQPLKKKTKASARAQGKPKAAAKPVKAIKKPKAEKAPKATAKPAAKKAAVKKAPAKKSSKG